MTGQRNWRRGVRGGHVSVKDGALILTPIISWPIVRVGGDHGVSEVPNKKAFQ